MKKLLEFLVQSIVQHPKELSVSEDSEGKILNLTLKAHPDDIKIIIGKKGQTIRALRELVKIKALQNGQKVNIIVSSPPVQKTKGFSLPAGPTGSSEAVKGDLN